MWRRSDDVAEPVLAAGAPAKAAKSKKSVETSTPASVKPMRIDFGGIQRAAELPDDLVPSILGKLFAGRGSSEQAVEEYAADASIGPTGSI